jgi:hypothetical protein
VSGPLDHPRSRGEHGDTLTVLKVVDQVSGSRRTRVQASRGGHGVDELQVPGPQHGGQLQIQRIVPGGHQCQPLPLKAHLSDLRVRNPEIVTSLPADHHGPVVRRNPAAADGALPGDRQADPGRMKRCLGAQSGRPASPDPTEAFKSWADSGGSDTLQTILDDLDSVNKASSAAGLDQLSDSCAQLTADIETAQTGDALPDKAAATAWKLAMEHLQQSASACTAGANSGEQSDFDTMSAEMAIGVKHLNAVNSRLDEVIG